MRKLIRFLPFIISVLFSQSIAPQSVTKEIVLTGNEAYTDHIALTTDSRDMDLVVKLSFDEQKNQLTATLYAYRSLFVFADNVRYKTAFRHRRLQPDRLPYVVEDTPDTLINLSKRLKKQIPKPRRRFVFQRWFGCEGMQPVPQMQKLVNDRVQQTFDITGQTNEVTLTLRHLLIMDLVKLRGERQTYQLIHLSDLDRTYRITLQRNPCLGKDVERETAAAALDGVKQCYLNLARSYPAGAKTEVEAEYSQFRLLKEKLTDQFPRHDGHDSCTDIDRTWQEYNNYVDSLNAVRLTYVPQEEKGGGIDADILLGKARQIDKMVTRWLASTDKTERRDLNLQCHQTIQEVTQWVEAEGLHTDEQERAWKVFTAARRYYNDTVVGKGHK